MIKITVGISKEHIAVKCVGHANYNICGEDIVCSAISTLLQTLCYSLEELTPNKINTSLEKGEGYIGIYHPTCKAITLVKGFMIGCREISNRYPDYVQLEIKE
ncbi:ribosomal-processing cysteine protease Prp [Faecalibacillus intestinalis]|uniref:ribosomal-processing cysteine protease Prp n=1 Tax=Faecalibacillus intestinalis TaxID=1982626 RepID=UPI0022E721E2|nr:ribosomal-processing cysteine protease Prp [Faecalibacillus intestinalis]